MDFGQKIKYVRELRGLTQTQLAELCDLAPSFISQIENNKRRPATETLERLAQQLHATAYYFIDDKALTFEEHASIVGYIPPQDIVDFFAQQDSLPYAVLAKDLKDSKIDPEYLRELIEIIKKNQPK